MDNHLPDDLTNYIFKFYFEILSDYRSLKGKYYETLMSLARNPSATPEINKCLETTIDAQELNGCVQSIFK